MPRRAAVLGSPIAHVPRGPAAPMPGRISRQARTTPDGPEASQADLLRTVKPLGELPTAVQAVLTGYDPAKQGPLTTYNGKPVPEHGCLREPDRLLAGGGGGVMGPGNGADGLVTKIKAKSYSDSMADPRVTAVFRAWSSCMKAAGYQLENPMLAAANLPLTDGAAPSDAEITQARADVACKSQANLVGVWFAVESDYQNAAIAQKSKELAGVKATLTTEVSDIHRLLSTMQE